MSAAELTSRFTYHPPKGDQPQRYEQIRAEALQFALIIDALVPDSREKSTALTKLDEVVFFANAAIARREPVAAPKPEPRDIQHRSWDDLPRID